MRENKIKPNFIESNSTQSNIAALQTLHCKKTFVFTILTFELTLFLDCLLEARFGFEVE